MGRASVDSMDAAALYAFDVRGYVVLPAVLDAQLLAVLNAEVTLSQTPTPHPEFPWGWRQ